MGFKETSGSNAELMDLCFDAEILHKKFSFQTSEFGTNCNTKTVLSIHVTMHHNRFLFK